MYLLGPANNEYHISFFFCKTTAESIVMFTLLPFLLFACLLATAMKSPRNGLLSAVFLVPWMGLDADIGLWVTGYRLAIFALVLAIFIRMVVVSKRKHKLQSNNIWLTTFIVYSVIVSILQLYWLPSVSLESGSLRSGMLRPIIQIFMFALMLAPIFLVPRIVRKPEDIIDCGRIYLWSMTILALLGWFQLFLWYGAGFNPFPIGYVSSLVSGNPHSVVREGIDWVGSVPIYRMNSLAGEPKGLAHGLAVALLVLQSGAARIRSITFSKRKSAFLWGFLALSLLFTWSTSGIFLWLIGTITISFVGLGGFDERQNRKIFLTSLGFIAFVIIAVSAVSPSSNGKVSHSFVSTLVSKRFIERSPIEDYDETIIKFLKDQKKYLVTGVGLGNVHVYANKYIPSYAKHYMTGNVFVAKSGYLHIVSELGVLGLFILFFAIFSIFIRINNSIKLVNINSNEKTLGRVLFVVGIVTFIGGMARTYIWSQMFIMLGLCVAYPMMLSWKQRVNIAFSKHPHLIR